MAFNPTIYSTNQGMARGIETASNAIAMGIQQYQANETKGQQAAAAFGGRIAANPYLQELLTKDQDAAKRAEKMKSGKATLDDKLWLAGWASSAEEGQKEAAARQLETLKRNQFLQDKADQDMQKAKLQQIYNFSRNVGTGVYSAPEQARMNAEMASNPLLKTAAQSYGATREIPRSDTLLNTQSREEIAAINAQHRDALSGYREELARSKLELDRAKFELTTANADKKFGDGYEREFTFNGQKRIGFVSKGEFLDKETGLPISTKQFDQFGQVTADGVPNPVLFGPSSKPGGGLPGAAGGGEPAPVVAPIRPPKYKEGEIRVDRTTGVRRKYVKGKWVAP